MAHDQGMPRNSHATTLTDREREVLSLIAAGHSNRAISEQLWLSAKTVESHISSIFSKLGITAEPHRHRRVTATLAYLDARAAA